MTKEEKNKLIDYMVSGDRQKWECIRILMDLQLKYKLVIYEHIYENKKWDKVAVELGYSVRQKKNIENDGLEMMYEKLKDVL